MIPSISFNPRTSTQQLCIVNHVYVSSKPPPGMLASVLLIVSGAPSTIVKARPPKIFGPETVDMQFSAGEKELTSDSRLKGSGSLRMHRCNFVARDQDTVKSFKSILLHRIAASKTGHQKRTCTWNMEHGEEHVGTCSFYMMSMYYEHVEHTEGTC